MIYAEDSETGLIISEDGHVYREVSQWSDKNGYKYVTHNRKNISVHRLVAKVFVPGRSDANNIVMHKDDNPANNHCNNLEWGTYQKNNDDAVAHGLRRNVYPVRCMETGEEFRSAREAAVKKFGRAKLGDSIIRVAKGGRSKTQNLHWEVISR